MKTLSVREQLLEHTQTLIRRGGLKGFSYRDLAELVGVKTSSIHYYFPTKDDIVLEAVKLYTGAAAARIAKIDTTLPATEQAQRYLDPLLGEASAEICLVAMLSTDSLSLSEPVQRALRGYYMLNETWIAGLLDRAQAEHGRKLAASPMTVAKVIFAALQNAKVSARLFGDTGRARSAAEMLLAVTDVRHPSLEAGELTAEALLCATCENETPV